MSAPHLTDPVLRARVWAAWVEAHPYDSDATPEEQGHLLDTIAGHMLALEVQARDVTGPAGVALRAHIDQAQARWRDLSQTAVARALGLRP